LITNATDRLDADLAAAGLSAHYDHIANSSKLDSAKPDREIFAAAPQMVGCKASEAVLSMTVKPMYWPPRNKALRWFTIKNSQQCLQVLAMHCNDLTLLLK